MDTTLKKLRVKFIAIIMAVVAVVLAAVFTIIVLVDYDRSTNEVYAALDSALFHDAVQNQAPAVFPDKFSLDVDKLKEDIRPKNIDSANFRKFEIGSREKDQSFIPVAVYEFTNFGQLLLVSGATSGVMSEETLKDVSSKIDAMPEGRGFLESIGVFYVKQTRGNTSFVAFADEGSVSEWKSLALTLVGIGTATLVVFFIISLVFSKWALKPVEESWKKQQQFVADASHELKTPLTVMAADASILMRHPEKTIASQSQWLESMETEINNMQELVGDMLQLASEDAQGKVSESNFSRVNFSKTVNSLVLQFESLAYERGIDFTAEVEDGVFIEGIPDKLRRLASTLMDNAFKYVSENGHVGVRLSRVGKFADLSVNNSGPAISKEDLPHIFDRFYRADKSREHDENRSFGLGLAIASEIAKSHGGSLSAKSDNTSGTTLTALLPLSE